MGSGYHFAFEAGSETGLDEKRKELLVKGVEVTGVVDHNWAKSIYFKDFNGIQPCLTRDLNGGDARMQYQVGSECRRVGERALALEVRRA